jgi:hypothetical protein
MALWGSAISGLADISDCISGGRFERMNHFIIQNFRSNSPDLSKCVCSYCCGLLCSRDTVLT